MRSSNIFPAPSNKKWKLARNENLTKFGSLYPDYRILHDFLEENYEVPKEYICLTSGAEEAIRICLSSPIYKNRLHFFPTWGLTPFLNNFYGDNITSISLNSDLQYEAQALEQNLDKDQIVYLANPNNVGSTLSINYLVELIDNHPDTIFLIDETYYQFNNYESILSLVPKYKNLIVVRSYSKAHGLAKERAGFYATINEHFIDMRPANPMSKKAIKSVIKSYNHVSLSVKLLEEGKQYVENEFKNNFNVIETKGNFIVIKYDDYLNTFLRNTCDYQVFEVESCRYIKITALPIDLAIEFMRNFYD